MPQGQILLDPLGWSQREDIELPKTDPATGVPTGETITVRQIVLFTPDGLQVILRMTPEVWDEKFEPAVAGRNIVIANGVPPALSAAGLRDRVRSGG